MHSPSPQQTITERATVRGWLEARTETSLRSGGWTPERDLHDDYAAWCAAEGHPRELILVAELFEEALNGYGIATQRRHVSREGQLSYEPCRQVYLIPPIQAAA